MNTSMKTRYKMGEKCPGKGNYKFDGYVARTITPSPTAEERRIPLDTGETFPPNRSCEKDCFWVRDQALKLSFLSDNMIGVQRWLLFS
jgi:hypothetical protein